MKKAVVPSTLVAVVLLALGSDSRGAAADQKDSTRRIPLIQYGIRPERPRRSFSGSVTKARLH